ncbi:hypothetical protein AOLI_G00197350 [Acnodon oligacanthus]
MLYSGRGLESLTLLAAPERVLVYNGSRGSRGPARLPSPQSGYLREEAGLWHSTGQECSCFRCSICCGIAACNICIFFRVALKCNYYYRFGEQH